MRGERSIETIKLGLDEIAKHLSRDMTIDEFTDLSAEVHIVFTTVKKMDESNSERIKADLIARKKTTVEAENWWAVMNKVRVTRLDTDSVKEFLGKRLKQFSTSKIERRLSYKHR